MSGARDDLETLFARRREIDRALLEEHSRELVILFTDIVGSTQFFEAKGDIAGLELVRRHNELLFPIVQGHGGRIVKTIGDAIMAVFEDANGAVGCAMQMQRALAQANAAGTEDPIHIRVGAHFGRALLDGEKDVFGDAVNTAARVVNQARGDEIVISSALRDQVVATHGNTLVPRGSFQAKGKSEALPLFAVIWGDGAPKVTVPEARAPEAKAADTKAPDANAAHAAPAAGKPAEPARRREEIFVLELQVGGAGIKVAALDGDAGKGTIKAYAELETSRAKLDIFSQRFTPFMRGGGTKSYLERVEELGASLFEAALSEHARTQLRETPLEFLRVQLDDQLVPIPWELLHDGQDFLSLRFAMGRVVSARAEMHPRAPTRPAEGHHALVVSNPSGDLEAAVREGSAVAGLLRDGYRGEVRHMLGPVTRKELLDALPGCALLHFAGHAEQPSSKSSGGFRVSDGVVTAEEIAAACGSGAPSFVFANGCHASSGEGFRGSADRAPDLASAFLFSGARHFVGPRWDVADEDALIFALRFYEKALSGLSLGEAVRAARSALKASEEARPLSFAGYVLYGEPRQGFPKEQIKLGAEAATRSPQAREDLASLPVALKGKGPPRPKHRPLVALMVALPLLAAGAAGVVWLRGHVRPSLVKEQPNTGTVLTPENQNAPPRAAPLTGPVRMCVLPFKNISGDPELDFLRDGMTEAVMTDFGHNRGVRLIERAQVDLEIQELEFSNSKYVDPQTRAKIGEIEGAEVVVMGGFQRAGSKVRAHARFVRVETGEILKAVRVESEIPAGQEEALFGLQDELALNVRGALQHVVDRVRPAVPGQ